MTNIVAVGYITEGPTDNRFLGSIIQRSFEKIALDCRGQIDVLPAQEIKIEHEAFIPFVTNATVEAEKRGINILCIHTDSDHIDDSQVFENKIVPAFTAIQENQTISLKNLVALVPVQMTEAWMLADIQLLKRELNTNLRNEDLGLTKRPELYRDPKATIENSIQIINQGNSRRRGRYKLSISTLYSPIGQLIDLDILESLQSYHKFSSSIRDAYQKLNYL